MKTRARVLVLSVVFSVFALVGAQAALAAEEELPAETELPLETEASPFPEIPGDSYGQMPSDKRGLQEEDGYLYYYDSYGYRVTGWEQDNGSVYYFNSQVPEVPQGSALTGMQKLDSDSYFFNEAGVLQTGWVTVGAKRYYGAKSGAFGMLGKLYTGLHKIEGKRYFFDAEGEMKTGWVTYEDKTYYFWPKKSSEKYGTACTGWQTISKQKYFFAANGAMKRDCWVKKKYYVDSDGKLLKSCVTPDGYIVDAKGKKVKRANGFVKVGSKIYFYSSGEMAVGVKLINGKRYYFKKSGVRKDNGWVTVKKQRYYIKDGVVQTGWLMYKGKKYYLASNGRMAKNKTVDGVELDENGEAPIAVMIVSGHGQGDPGASATCGSTYYQEDRLTREFASLICKQMQKVAPEISVVLYDQNYDCYQVLSNKKSGPKPNFKAYDYVLEIHFNASYSKDPGGNGVRKGSSIYINASKQNTVIDQKIVAAVARAGGLPIWGGGTGLMRSSGLFNAKTLQAMGVSYGLLETAFIDDRDDMDAYSSKKTEMAKAAATAIADYFGV